MEGSEAFWKSINWALIDNSSEKKVRKKVFYTDRTQTSIQRRRRPYNFRGTAIRFTKAGVLHQVAKNKA